MPQIGVEYQVHMQDIGWGPWVQNGVVAGTKDESRRVEAIQFHLINIPDGEEVYLQGNPHVENLGWTGYMPEKTVCGTTGQSLKLEALQFQLSGKDAYKYSIQYRASNVQNIGTMEWTRDNGEAGTEGGDLRLEAVQMLVTDKDIDLAGYERAFVHFDPTVPAPEPDPQQPVDDGNYFGPDDFKCACGCGGDVCQEIKDLANRVRAAYGYPLVCSSGFRCEYQNEKDGGIVGSLHTIGHAADMYAPGRMSYEEVDALAQVILDCGGGVIRYHDQLFCHMQLEYTDWSMN